MRLWIVAVGSKMPAWIDQGFSEYAKRMPREAALELIEVRPEKRVSGKGVEQVLEAERVRIEAALPERCERIVLDERGKSVSTVQLAQAMTGWMREARDVAFVIGSADGLHAALKAPPATLWQLSALTLPHGLVRVMLAEQLYRAQSILRGHPYHRE